MTITGAQIRAARGFLRWTIADLASAAEVGDSTIKALEKDDGTPEIKGGGVIHTLEHRKVARANALIKVQDALERAGITFLPETSQGVGIRGHV